MSLRKGVIKPYSARVCIEQMAGGLGGKAMRHATRATNGKHSHRYHVRVCVLYVSCDMQRLEQGDMPSLIGGGPPVTAAMHGIVDGLGREVNGSEADTSPTLALRRAPGESLSQIIPG